MSFMGDTKDYAIFAARVAPVLVQLVKPLYYRFHGNADAAVGFVRRIPEFWDDVAADRAKRDLELDELRSQGK